jgi:XTP/dITP diphosphohydrolase
VQIPTRIVVASANPKKAAELADILGSVGGHLAAVELVPRPPDIPDVVEDAPDFLGNARLKAAALARATGLAALADDSGLEVDALGGEPGVRSARYAGDGASDADNVARLLAELERAGAASPQARNARFVCVVVLRLVDGSELLADGSVEGYLATAPAGDDGFGYDPVFIPHEGDGRTFAEMTPAEKHQISHRGRALHTLVELLGRD